MAIGGEQGSAKSTRSALLRSVIDPRHPTLRSLPRDERDLVVAARNQHVLAFDNVSGLRHWLSDALCRIASGAGFGTRELYTDQEEVVFSGARPIILNGIEEVVERPDLAERSIFRHLRADRPQEPEVGGRGLGVLRRCACVRPRRVARCGRDGPQALSRDPAAGPAAHGRLRPLGDRLRAGAVEGAARSSRAYNANILGAVESVLEASPVAVAVRKLMADLAKALQGEVERDRRRPSRSS